MKQCTMYATITRGIMPDRERKPPALGTLKVTADIVIIRQKFEK
jgi:hypothetical protein